LIIEKRESNTTHGNSSLFALYKILNEVPKTKPDASK
jgi:hypothetical protein